MRHVTLFDKFRSAYTNFVGKHEGHLSLKYRDRYDINSEINGYPFVGWAYLNIDRIL
jgi:hypothetical protein